MHNTRFSIIFILSLFFSSSCKFKSTAQTKTLFVENQRIQTDAFELPLEIEPSLSGNFAELRVNHFHSGLDFKTQQRTGLPIYAPSDGWVSRIRIGSSGFGNALYINHSNGFTTVYGHLLRYAEPIASAALKMQYKKESFELDTLLSNQLLKVKKGQIIAYSGNSGASAAPHLHFEIRDTKTEETIDPLLWFGNKFKDHQAPRIKKLAIYALENEGILGNNAQKAYLNVVKNEQGVWSIPNALPNAWGKIGFGLNAYDYMDGSSNIYGICSVKLYQDNELVFFQDLSRFNFDQTRSVNSLIDYELKVKENSWIFKSFLDPGNTLKAFPVLKDRGICTIDSARSYSFRYELTDRAGNSTVLNFTIQGVKKQIPTTKLHGQKLGYWLSNTFSRPDFNLAIPMGALYADMDFVYKQQTSTGYSDVYEIGNRYIPLHLPMAAKFRIQKDVLSNKKQYYVAKLNPNGSTTAIASKYKNGWMEASLKEFASYRILSDTIAPKITPANGENIVKNNLIRIQISDAASGIRSWRGTIDGKWVLFAFDGKTGWLTCELNSTSLTKGMQHRLELFVYDACGNVNKFQKIFSW